MFMGDAGATTEKEIMNKYNLSNMDVLKVGHHGSRTSSSKDFINEINLIILLLVWERTIGMVIQIKKY